MIKLCEEKKAYSSESTARLFGSKACVEHSVNHFWTYKCGHCNKWHLTTHFNATAPITKDSPRAPVMTLPEYTAWLQRTRMEEINESRKERALKHSKLLEEQAAGRTSFRSVAIELLPPHLYNKVLVEYHERNGIKG